MKEWRLTTGAALEPKGASAYHDPVFIGKGSYGSVHLYTAKSHKKPDFALKSFVASIKRGVDYTILRELSFYGYLAAIGGHPALPRVTKVIWSADGVELPMAYCGRGMSTRGLGELHPKDKHTVAHQAIDAIYFLHHSMGIVQRDIKSANLVWDQGVSRLSLVDWGISRFFDRGNPYETMTPLVQTLPYRAPEILLGDTAYTAKAEVWSLGILLLELWTGHISVSTKGEIEQLLHYFRLFGTPDETTWPSVTDLPHYSPSFPKWCPHDPWHGLTADQSAFVQGLLVMDPTRRWSMAKVREEWYARFGGQGELPPVYPQKVERDAAMGEAFALRFEREADKQYLARRQALWAAFSEMEAKAGDAHATLAYAMSLVDRLAVEGLPARVDWHLLVLAAVWVVSKLGASSTTEDVDDCMDRVPKIGSHKGFGRWSAKALVKHEKLLLTGLGFCLVDLSPHRFWRLLAKHQSLPFYNCGVYLLDLWEASPAYNLVAPQEAAHQVYSIVHDKCFKGEVGAFLRAALANPLAYKDVSTRLRHALKESEFSFVLHLE